MSQGPASTPNNAATCKQARAGQATGTSSTAVTNAGDGRVDLGRRAARPERMTLPGSSRTPYRRVRHDVAPQPDEGPLTDCSVDDVPGDPDLELLGNRGHPAVGAEAQRDARIHGHTVPARAHTL